LLIFIVLRNFDDPALPRLLFVLPVLVENKPFDYERTASGSYLSCTTDRDNLWKSMEITSPVLPQN